MIRTCFFRGLGLGDLWVMMGADVGRGMGFLLVAGRYLVPNRAGILG